MSTKLALPAAIRHRFPEEAHPLGQFVSSEYLHWPLESSHEPELLSLPPSHLLSHVTFWHLFSTTHLPLMHEPPSMRHMKSLHVSTAPLPASHLLVAVLHLYPEGQSLS
jgi:hypothetical protein